MTDDLRIRRDRVLAPSYQLFYDDPVHLVRGEDVWVFEQNGNRLLDCYNNVPSVGHAHPRVVAALTAQAGLINTHTRYLHHEVVRLGERLGSLLPGELGVCYFVCTGTEANDLAVEIARTVTGHHGVVVSEHSYHGNSSLVAKLSTDGYPAEERPDWLGVIDAPNRYRNRFGVGADAASAASAFAGSMRSELDALGSRGHAPAAWLLDASWDSNGVLVAPPGYVEQCATMVRGAGGLVIADEVQAGYCRLGHHFWGHLDYDLVPDIVTLGKPMGAGHPIAAVITTPAIAAAFAEQRSYFNTFGGNPVSAAVANAVLDVIEEQRLLDNARAVGAYLGARLDDLASRHEMIGNVAGTGLFWGLDLVADRETREPIAYDDGRRLATALRHDGILTGLVGPNTNVLKIRPPLTFGIDHADVLVDTLDQRLENFELRGGSSRRRPGAEW